MNTRWTAQIVREWGMLLTIFETGIILRYDISLLTCVWQSKCAIKNERIISRFVSGSGINGYVIYGSYTSIRISNNFGSLLTSCQVCIYSSSEVVIHYVASEIYNTFPTR